MKKRSSAILSAFVLVVCIIIGIILRRQGEHTYTVGICQYTQHESLDAATRGFQDALTDRFGDSIVFDERNANGDYSICTTVINELIYGDVDLILANSTNSLQAASALTTEIPILGTAVTDYGSALQLADFDGTVGGNISGASDLVPADGQAAMIRELFPDADRIGILYCSSEQNSQYQAQAMETALDALGYTYRSYPFVDSNDLSNVTASAASECSVIFLPTDNTAAASAGLIANICLPEGIPVITGDESTCQICGAATLSVNYYDLGYATGEMAARILADGEDIAALPIQYPSSFTKKYNKDICSQLGIEVPEDYVPLKAE